MPRDRDLDAADIPSTYVPARNTIFLSLALGWAEVLGAHDIVIGVNALDYSGYPDCRPEFIARVRAPGAASRRAPASKAARFRVHTPLIALTKAEIIRRGLALGLDYGLTHSCYDPAPDGRPVRHAATAACCGPGDSAKPASPTRCSCAKIARTACASSEASPSGARSSASPARCSCRLRLPPPGRPTSPASNTSTSSASRRAPWRRPPAAYLNQYLTGLDSMASALTRHPAVIALDRDESRPAVRGGAARSAAARQHRPHRHRRHHQRQRRCPSAQTSTNVSALAEVQAGRQLGQARRQRADDRRRCRASRRSCSPIRCATARRPIGRRARARPQPGAARDAVPRHPAAGRLGRDADRRAEPRARAQPRRRASTSASRSARSRRSPRDVPRTQVLAGPGSGRARLRQRRRRSRPVAAERRHSDQPRGRAGRAAVPPQPDHRRRSRSARCCCSPLGLSTQISRGLNGVRDAAQRDRRRRSVAAATDAGAESRARTSCRTRSSRWPPTCARPTTRSIIRSSRSARCARRCSRCSGRSSGRSGWRRSACSCRASRTS